MFCMEMTGNKEQLSTPSADDATSGSKSSFALALYFQYTVYGKAFSDNFFCIHRTYGPKWANRSQ